MKYTQPDGALITFSLNDAVAITGGSITRLRNHIARDILKYVGQVPLAGQERRFAVWGLYEIGLINALSEANYTLEEAATVVHAAFKRSLEIGYLDYCQKDPEMTKPLSAIEGMPEYWLTGFWTHRKLTDPRIWVFGRLMGAKLFGPRVAKGWQHVPAIAIELQKEVYQTVTPPVLESESLGRRSYRVADIGDNHPSAHSALPVLGLLNVTAVLSSLDAAIEKHLKR
jgi:hypothetical protein